MLLILTPALASLGAISLLQSQQSPAQGNVSLNPQIELAGSGVTSLDFGREGLFGGTGEGSTTQINLSDSALAVGVSQRMYDDAIGSFTFGGLTVDDSNTGVGNQFFLNQAFVNYQGLRHEFYLGRTDRPAAQVVTFPTLREDDIIDFTAVANPFSNGRNVEEHRYANEAAYVYNADLRHFVNVHAEHLIDSAGVGSTSTGINAFGAIYQYVGNPAYSPTERAPTWSFGYEHRAVASAAGGASDVFFSAGTLNLRPGLVHRIDLRWLAQSSFGNDTGALAGLNDTYRADQNVLAVSVRKLYSPFGKPASQWALTAGVKSYPRVTDASGYGLTLSYARSLGDGFDAVAQFGYEQRTSSLAAAFGGRRDSFVFQIGFAYNFASIFNQSVGPRRSPTNLMHRYIPN